MHLQIAFAQLPWNENHTKYTGGGGLKSEGQAKLPFVPKQTCPEPKAPVTGVSRKQLWIVAFDSIP
jgi:hypothetical protein